MKVLRVAGGLVPFLRADGPDGASYINLFFNWATDRLEIPIADLLLMLATSRSDEIVLARRLNAREVEHLRDHRRDADHEASAYLIPKDDLRWRLRRGRGR